jgi:uncharacterized protein YgiB involved in biofilm formation
MTPPENQPQPLQPLQIHRQRVYQGLAIASVLALLVSSCTNTNTDSASTTVSEAEANEPIDAVFYKDTAQCEADIKKQQAEYAVLQKSYQAGHLEQPPTAPPMKVEDCAPQMQAAQETHDKTAPRYGSIEECESEGVKCEFVPAGDASSGQTDSTQAEGYRPVYGGTYISPFFLPVFTSVMYGGNPYRVYENRTVYQSSTPGSVVTPYGREISQTTTGRVSVPRHTTFAAPSRPPGTAGAGTIKGRSSQGFGSTYKSTGTGGK